MTQTPRSKSDLIISCSKRIEWDSAHRLMNHEGACASLHGHRYAAVIHCTATELDAVGRVVDFGVIKRVLKKWIDQKWDHATILNRDDLKLIEFLVEEARTDARRKPPYIMDEPTAENMAAELLRVAQELLSTEDVKVMAVDLFETPSSWATVA